MSRNQRIGLIVGAIVFAVVAFVIASPGGDDDGGSESAQTTTTQSQSETGQQETPTETEAPAETVPAEPKPTQIQIRGGEVVGGAADIQAKKGDVVQFVVSSDAPDDIHLHGYDIEKKVEPGKPTVMSFKASIPGRFPVEVHGGAAHRPVLYLEVYP